MAWEIRQGDCIERMAEMEEASVDAVVCDPPYGIGFMGHEWDQPGEQHGPVAAAGDEVELQAGKRRRSQPQNTVSYGGDPHPAMEAGRYDLSLTANRRYQGWCEAWAREAFRILKPGGHLLASCGTRTYHRLAAGVEDAGFEIRDSIMWLYGSGFPKSLDVSKAIDKAAGVEREVVGPKTYADGTQTRPTARQADPEVYGDYAGDQGATAPATPEAAQWEGWGTALKPAHEPIVVARKPLIGTVAGNFLEHGTGGINVDGCRLEAHDDQLAEKYASVADAGARGNAIYGRDRRTEPHGAGRFPANVILSEEAAAELDEQSGDRPGQHSQNDYGTSKGFTDDSQIYGGGGGKYEGRREGFNDSGGASRFFYCAKTSRAERNAGLEHLPVTDEKPTAMSGAKNTRECNICGSRGKPHGPLGDQPWPTCGHDDWSWSAEGYSHKGAQRNNHPTVKPINLMRWLVRLVTPPNGTCLDPFLGSGSTGCAAVLEGFDFIGIEREPDYIATAEARIAFWSQHVGREVEDVLGLHSASVKAKKAHADLGQGTLDLGAAA